MPHNSKKTVSLWFLFFVFLMIGLIIYYLFIPRSHNKQKSYEDLLESRPINQEQIQIKKQIKTPSTSISQINNTRLQNSNIPGAFQSKIQTYDNLLDELKQYPANNETYIRNIVNKILIYKGYNANTIPVKATEISQEKAKTTDTYMAANFDFKTGNLNISKNLITKTDKKVIIAIIAHELDHFDKLAKVCKYIGLEKFKELFENNRIPNIDTTFWKKASDKADIENFNGEYYKEALERFLTQNDLELLSSYSNFYRLAENMRNPLEISAYEASDYVYNHYGIKIEDGSMRKLTKQFNDTDWAIYNEISKNKLLQSERIPVFDYFFAKAIVNRFPELKEQFERCNKQKDGDLTDFWLAFEGRYKSFYGKSPADDKAFNTMYTLLNDTEQLAKNGLTPQEAATALKYKINILITNLVYPKAIENLQKTALNYLTFIKENNIKDDKEELKCIITLICIENKLYTDNKKEISLYYINIPENLLRLYKTENKRQFLLSIYKNEYFKSQKGTMQESQYMAKILNESKLNLKINH